MSAEMVRALFEAAEEWTPVDLQLSRLPRSDIGNAERLVARFGSDLLHARETGWYAFDGRRWSLPVGAQRARQCAHDTVKAIRAEAVAVRDEGRKGGESDKDFQERVVSHLKWSTQSGFAARVSGMLGESETLLPVSPADFDADPLKLNVGNGTLALGGEAAGGIVLRPADRADRISRCASIQYDPEAVCPTFRRFLARIQPDPSVQLFLQQWFGYCLTGEAGEQRMVVMWGGGANGKSTLIDTLCHVLGDYSAGLPFASLASDDNRRGDAASPDLARLPGVRLVRASESKMNVRLDEAMVKAVTGGEPIQVRQLYGEFFDLRPVFKLTLSTNHKPVIRGGDTGIWRRVVLVPFLVEIPEGERDRDLPAKLRAEAPGILNWMLDGLRLWFERGLVAPESVVAATTNFRAESDHLAAFLEAAVLPADRICRVSAKDLYGAYTDWCRANAVDPMGTTGFGRAMADRGYDKARGHVVAYLSVSLAPEYLPEAIAGRRSGPKPAEDG